MFVQESKSFEYQIFSPQKLFADIKCKMKFCPSNHIAVDFVTKTLLEQKICQFCLIMNSQGEIS